MCAVPFAWKAVSSSLPRAGSFSLTHSPDASCLERLSLSPTLCPSVSASCLLAPKQLPRVLCLTVFVLSPLSWEMREGMDHACHALCCPRHAEGAWFTRNASLLSDRLCKYPEYARQGPGEQMCSSRGLHNASQRRYYARFAHEGTQVGG